ncbi:hypothetical protein PV516_19095 [Streptomyces scabiei]|uniref:hypothetical protein n=1 Tax=Streptomyces scabiei TaxID=1930 RepID=UPI0029B29F0A|nr:hypothetical protein [Streptomyces scabiei]MDX3165895.1 hypothetical protein [Streptomyces scabiei]
MGAIILAVAGIAGTLLASIVTGLLQHRSAARVAAEARTERLYRDQLEAATALAKAATEHRIEMWRRGDAVLKGDPADQIRELQTRTHATRGAVTLPFITCKLLITDPAVRQAAVTMVSKAYAMRDAYDSAAALTEARDVAMRANDDFVDTAAAFLAR